MRLKELLLNVTQVNVTEDTDIKGLTQDSRTIKPGYLFLAYPGLQTDGRLYLVEAVKKGAAAILIEATQPVQVPTLAVPILKVNHLAQKVSHIAACFYHHPSQAMQLIGVTGTNGKSSCTHFLANCLAQSGESCGIIGSVACGIYEAKGGFTTLKGSTLTTPDAIELQALLAVFKKRSIRIAVIEASSHGLKQGRLNSLFFKLAGFTNLTLDHLDYHQTLSAYAESKKKIFLQAECAVLNQDDHYSKSWGPALKKELPVYSYTLHPSSFPFANTVSARIIKGDHNALRAQLYTPWGQAKLNNPFLMGTFNISNLLLVLIMLNRLGTSLADSLHYINQLRAIKGRMEKISYPKKPLVVIDYAHTPDALEKALATLQDIRGKKGRVWCVFGCGGNRDRGKRPLMGAIAEQYADRIILTQDNPRSESTHAITQCILSGINAKETVKVIADRAMAIQQTIEQASAEDIVLIAGKGHERQQIIAGVAYPFSDHAVAEATLKASHLPL